jgi:hypothetical protein
MEIKSNANRGHVYPSCEKWGPLKNCRIAMKGRGYKKGWMSFYPLMENFWRHGAASFLMLPFSFVGLVAAYFVSIELVALAPWREANSTSIGTGLPGRGCLPYLRSNRLLTGFMPCRPRFVSGVKRHVIEIKIKLREAPPRRRGASKTLICSVALILRHCGVPKSTPHYS